MWINRIRKSKSARNAGASFFAFFSTALAGLLSIPVAVRYFRAEEIGLWTAVNMVIAYLLWVDLGIGVAAGRKIAPAVAARDQRELDEWWSTIQIGLWVLGGLVALLGIACIPLVLNLLRIPPDLHSDAWLLLVGSSIIAALNFPLRAIPGLLTAQERFHWVPICQAIMPWLQLGGFWLMASLGKGLSSYLWGTFLSQFFVFVFYRSLVFGGPQIPHTRWRQFHRAKFRELLGFGLNLSLAGFKDIFLQSLPTLVLSRYGGIAMVPIYTFTAKAPQMAAALARRVYDATYPGLQRRYVEGKSDEFLAGYRKAFTATCAVSNIIACGILFINPSIVSLIASPAYFAGTKAGLILASLVIIGPASFMMASLMHISGSMGKTWAVSLTLILASFFAAIPAFHTFGIAGLCAVLALQPLLFGLFGMIHGCRKCAIPILPILRMLSVNLTASLSILVLLHFALTSLHSSPGFFSGKLGMLHLPPWQAILFTVLACMPSLWILKRISFKHLAS
jgi:O-antigen/teichoic acid export membrane protein